VRISADWLDASEMSAPELRATAALLAIHVGGQVVSRHHHVRRATVADFVVMPAYPLAEGLAHRWWQVIAGRGREVRLRLFRDGFAVPDIVLAPDGRNVKIDAWPFEYENPPLRFLNSAQEHLPVAEVERDLRAFIETVLARLDNCHVSNSVLAERWDAIAGSYGDTAERMFCEAAGALGVDPYTCTDAEAESIGDAAARFSADSLAEFLAAEAPGEIRADLDWLEANRERLAESGRLADLASLADEIRLDPEITRADAAPWQRGTRAARAVRKALQIDPEHRFDSAADIAGRLGNDAFEPSPQRSKNLRAVRLLGEHGAAVVVARQHVPTSTTFALGRAIGDIILFGEHGPAPITDRYTYRQAVGRAFAAELLAPAAAVVPMHADGWDEDELASHWRVSRQVITNQIKNNPDLAA
jgi:hypothetical protein